MTPLAALIAFPAWMLGVYALLRTRDWPQIRAAIRTQPSTAIGYLLVAAAIAVVCPAFWLI